MKQRKLITWLTAASLGICAAVCSAAGLTAKAIDDPATGLIYTYSTETGEATVTGYNGSSGDVVIPSSLGGHPVTKIGNEAFWKKSYTSVVIPDTVTAIGKYAFYRTDLQTVSLPAVTTVGEGAFSDCDDLTAVSMPQTVLIDSSAFSYCTSLVSVSAPLVQKVEDFAFKGCTALTSISLPASVTLVGQYAFANCTALTTAEINGPAVLYYRAFYNCNALTDVHLSPNSRSFKRDDKAAFYNCGALTKVNGVTVLSFRPDIDGISYPVLNSAALTAVRNHFCRSINVKFVNDYCTALCNYIVETETDPWMCESLKARQLHDWLVRHCEYEDNKNGEYTADMENHLASAVFLSYALNARGSCVGEAVCEGYAKAYTMLLAAAGIESYQLYSPGHSWNLVKADGQYYQTDVTWDDPVMFFGGDNTHGNPYSTTYTYFQKSNADMEALHAPDYQNPTVYDYENFEHPLLSVYTGDITDKLAQCLYSYADSNSDGILDNDFDLNGYASLSPDYSAFNGMLRFAFGVSSTADQINDRMPEVLWWLHYFHKDYWTYINDSTPTNQIAAAGQTAEFTVTLFGDQLSYQWYYYDTTAGQWIYAQQFYGSSFRVLSVPADDYSRDMYFMCVVINPEGYYIYSNPVQLTVI